MSTPILMYARFKRPLKIDWSPWYEFGAWLKGRDSYLIAAWGDTIWTLLQVRDLDQTFSDLRALLSPCGLNDLSFLEVGPRAWSFEREPPYEAELVFDGGFFTYDVEPECQSGEDDDVSNGEPTAESVFGPAADDNEDEDDSVGPQDAVAELSERLSELEWPITSWHAAGEIWWPGERRSGNNIEEWYARPFPVDRPKWGPKAMLLIFREDRREPDNLVERLRLALGPEAKVRCHGRRSILIVGHTDYGAEQICALENVSRRMKENRFLVTACFEVGPSERTLHASVQGSLIPPRPPRGASTLALESQSRWRRRGNGRGNDGRRGQFRGQ